MATITNYAEAEEFLTEAMSNRSIINVKREANDMVKETTSYTIQLESFEMNAYAATRWDADCEPYIDESTIYTDATLHGVNGEEILVKLFLESTEEIRICECDEHINGCEAPIFIPHNTWKFTVLA